MEAIFVVMLASLAQYTVEAYQYALPKIVNYYQLEVISWFILSAVWAIPSLICVFFALIYYRDTFKPAWVKAREKHLTMRDNIVTPFVMLIIGSVIPGAVSFGYLVKGLGNIATLFTSEGRVLIELLQ